jgi:site-specific DNA recombinase
MRRGRLTRLRAGQLLPWSRAPFGYLLDPEHPRDPACLHLDPAAAAVVQEMFAWYLDPGATVHSIALRLTQAGVLTPTGKPRWNVASVRGILKNPAYTGTAYGNRTRMVSATQRKSALLPVGPGVSYRYRPREEWIGVPVPALLSPDLFDRVQEKLAHNQQCSARNNTHFPYLLRALVSCGQCRLGTTARTMLPGGQSYYVCQGRSNALRRAQGQRCTARYIPGRALDELVWQDLCALLTEPEHLASALRRAHGGHWLPQELQARQVTLRQAVTQLDTAQQRLLDAYLAGVLTLAVFDRKRHELTRRQETLHTQQRQLDALAHQHITLSAVADSLETFCAQVRGGLRKTTFAQRRALVELLIDRVIVTDGNVEIRYVFPTTCHGPPIRFSHLRVDYLDAVALPVVVGARNHRPPAFEAPGSGATLGRDAHPDAAAPQGTTEVAAVVPAIGYQLLRSLLRAATRTSHADTSQRLLGECHLGAVGAVQVEAQRQTSTVDDEHPLGPFALLRQPDTRSPLFRRRERAVEVGHSPVKLATEVERREGRPPDAFPHALLAPPLEATPGGRRRAVLAWQILPATAAAEHIQDAFDDAAVIRSRSARCRRRGEQWSDEAPLCVGEMRSAHASMLSHRAGVLELPLIYAQASFHVLTRQEITMAKQYSAPPAMQIDPNKQYQAIFHTERGDFTVELFAKQAPITVNNFVFLAIDR